MIIMVINIIDVSGAGILASGQHVFVESGVHVASGLHVVADISVEVSSGLWVDGVSGIHVFVESGAHVIIRSGEGIVLAGTQVSGTISVSGAVIIQDTSGHSLQIDGTVPAAVTISVVHHEVHEGNMFRSCCIQSGLADDSALNMLVIAGSGKEVHAFFDGALGGDGWFYLYENTTVTSNGLLVPSNCMNRFVSGTAKTQVYCGPVVTSSMTPLCAAAIPGGTRQQAVGAQMRANTEWVLNGVSGTVNYLARIINVAGAVKDASLGVEFYEK